MNRDFEIRDSIYLAQGPHILDLHNCYDFTGLQYSVEHCSLCLNWRRSQRDGISLSLPSSLSIEFRNVGEFRFLPRNAALPFSEDDCLRGFGYWTDEDWSDGIMILGPDQEPDPAWLTAIDFMSGAIVIVRSESAHATIEI